MLSEINQSGIYTYGPILLIGKDTNCQHCGFRFKASLLAISNWYELDDETVIDNITPSMVCNVLIVLDNPENLEPSIQSFIKQYAPHLHNVGDMSNFSAPQNHCPHCGKEQDTKLYYEEPGDLFCPNYDQSFLDDTTFIKMREPGPFVIDCVNYFSTPSCEPKKNKRTQCGHCETEMPEGPWVSYDTMPGILYAQHVCQKCSEQFPRDVNSIYCSGNEPTFNGRELLCDKCNSNITGKNFVYDSSEYHKVKCMDCFNK